uniref:DNA mismatch repair proteins mutS family domain-containing protein n=1 Tax=viral metagenome TaxID=1070528 RepID=A0A6C0HG31_9ZZZZ
MTQTDINNEFKLPIAYIENKKEIEQHIITDLELKAKVTQQTEVSLYNYVFNPSNQFSQNTIDLWCQYYTSDKQFLKDSQKVIKKNMNYLLDSSQVDKVIAIMNEVKNANAGSGFNDKYYYIDIQMFESFNNNAQFLQWLSIYNMSSPVISLFLPVFFLILPLILLKLQGVPISILKYIEILKMVVSKHSIGQLFNIGSASWDKLIYIIISIGFYFLQVYQNIISCYRFYKNMKTIHEQLFVIRDYVDITLQHIEHYNQLHNGVKSYQPFITVMNKHASTLQLLKTDLDKVEPNKINIKKFKQVGHVMKCFYQLYKNKECFDSLNYSFGLNGYLDNLRGLRENIKQSHIAPCKIVGKNKKTKFVGAYFPTLVNSKPVKNTYYIDNHILITGPNAAGKTTLLKTTIFNIILSQQIGFGFYKKATLEPYDVIHCYINIPDTSGRDSLFQAEARRCKDILTAIDTMPLTTRHFCVFDELYSGTNPYEAIGSAYSFLNYLNKYKNVTFMLTTHYLDLCKRLDSTERIGNYNMKIMSDCSSRQDYMNFKYTYKMIKGISTIKGGIKVLIDLNYPKEIIENTHNFLETTF